MLWLKNSIEPQYGSDLIAPVYFTYFREKGFDIGQRSLPFRNAAYKSTYPVEKWNKKKHPIQG